MNGRIKSKACLIISIFLLGIACSVAAGRTIYVDDDASGANDGSSWTDAYNYLQDALADANSTPKPVEIRVAEGIYTPDSNSADPNGSGDREATFQLINGVTIKGGFAGLSESNPYVWDVNVYATVLSGDLADNDIEVSDPSKLLEEPTRAENSYHVVTGSGTDKTAILDGLIITAGNANSSEIDLYRGGGIYIYKSGSPTLIRCNFKCNSGKSGGGIYIFEGSPTLYSCVFQDNGAYNGSGIHHSKNNLTLDNCTFVGNAAQSGSAAGLYCGFNYENLITLSNCRFIQNSGHGIKFYYSPNFELVDCNFIENLGSGIEITGYLDPWRAIIKRCIFVRNSEPRTRGGGISCHGYNGLEITDCEFEGNNADEGGGIYLSGGNLDTFTFANCTLRGNSSKLRVGGGMYVRGGNPVIVNSIFCQNTADNYGGGLYLKYVEQAEIEHCVFMDNSSGYGGGGIGNDGYSSSLLSQCVFENNKAETYGGGIYNSYDCNVIINKCIFNRNSAGSGGGAIFNKGDNVTPTYDCLFTNNKADLGGAILNSNDCNYLINSCRFNGNLANNNGGGICNRARSSPTLINCEFTGNIAMNQGGAIHSSYQCNALVKNCTLSGNKAYEGGVIFVQRETDITILNCIFWDNSAIKGSNFYLVSIWLTLESTT